MQWFQKQIVEVYLIFSIFSIVSLCFLTGVFSVFALMEHLDYGFFYYAFFGTGFLKKGVVAIYIYLNIKIFIYLFNRKKNPKNLLYTDNFVRSYDQSQ